MIPPSVHYNCKPCLDRTQTKVAAVLPLGENGDDGHYAEIALALQEVGRNMRVQMYIARPALDDMAAEITAISNSADFQVLIISIPIQAVQDAVTNVIQQGLLPVFGVHQGYERQIPGLMGFVAMDDLQAGKVLANHLLNQIQIQPTAVTRLLVLSPDPLEANPQARRDGRLNSSLRLQGIKNALQEYSIISNSTMPVPLLAEVVLSPQDIAAKNLHLEGCPFDAIILTQGHKDLLQTVLHAYSIYECSFQEQLLVAFDTNPHMYRAISRKEVAFTISHDQYLQANLVATMAVLYATTGHYLGPPQAQDAPFGNFQTGARIIDAKTMPNDPEQVCERQAYPACPLGASDSNKQLESKWRDCPCRDRSQIRIAGIYHDDRAPSALQAAQDLGITLLMDRVKAVGNKQERMTQLAEKVKRYCQDRVDGVFLQVKHSVQAQAVQFCQDLNVPVFGVLPVIPETQDHWRQPIPTIGMDDFQAGYQMTKELLARGMKYGYCVNWSGAKQLLPRCDGMERAINETQLASNDPAQYMGILHGVSDDKEQMKVILEAGITVDDSSWNGVGLVMTGYKFVSGGLYAQESHPGLMFGTEGFSDLVYDSLENGSLVATTDLQQYLRGYFPVAILTWRAQTRQSLNTQFLPSGPKLIFEAPSEAQTTCMANDFGVCPEHQNKHQLDNIRPVGYTILAILLAFAFYCIAWVTIHRNVRIVRASQSVFLGAICAGCILMAITIVPLSFDDGMFNKESGGCVGCECEPCNVSCMAAPWLFSSGFTIVFASLFSKIWRINRLMKGAAKFRRLKLSILDVMKPFTALLLLNVVFNLVWTLVDPMYYERSSRCGSDEFTSYGVCKLGIGAVSTAMASCLLITNFCAVAMANYQAYQGRNLRTEFNESKFIALAMVLILQVMVVGVPLLFLVTDSPEALFFVQTGIIAIVCLSILGLLFVPKMRIHRGDVRKKEREKKEKDATQRAHATAVSADADDMSRGSSTSRGSTLGEGLKIRQRKIRFSSLLNGSSSLERGRESLTISSILPFGGRAKNKASGRPSSKQSDSQSMLKVLDEAVAEETPGARATGCVPSSNSEPEPVLHEGRNATDGLIVSVVEVESVDSDDEHPNPNPDMPMIEHANPNPDMPMIDESMTSQGGPLDTIRSVRELVPEDMAEETDSLGAGR